MTETNNYFVVVQYSTFVEAKNEEEAKQMGLDSFELKEAEVTAEKE